MANFELAIGHTIKHEGGYVKHPNDPGGATNHGITLKVARGRGSLADFDHDGDVDTRDMQLMPLAFAMEVYKSNYWHPMYSLFPQVIADKVFDIAVNAGPARAHKLLQQALGLTADGVLGKATLGACTACNAAETRATLRVLQKQFYEALILKNPKLGAFRNGWMTRAAY